MEQIEFTARGLSDAGEAEAGAPLRLPGAGIGSHDGAVFDLLDLLCGVRPVLRMSPEGVPDVLLLRHPFQVDSAVVGPDLVDVVHDLPGCGLSDESQGNQAVDGQVVEDPIDTKADTKVPGLRLHDCSQFPAGVPMHLPGLLRCRVGFTIYVPVLAYEEVYAQVVKYSMPFHLSKLLLQEIS